MPDLRPLLKNLIGINEKNMILLILRLVHKKLELDFLFIKAKEQNFKEL